MKYVLIPTDTQYKIETKYCIKNKSSETGMYMHIKLDDITCSCRHSGL